MLTRLDSFFLFLPSFILKPLPILVHHRVPSDLRHRWTSLWRLRVVINDVVHNYSIRRGVEIVGLVPLSAEVRCPFQGFISAGNKHTLVLEVAKELGKTKNLQENDVDILSWTSPQENAKGILTLLYCYAQYQGEMKVNTAKTRAGLHR